MDLLGAFILSIAGSIIGNLITKMIKTGNKVVYMKEIEKEVVYNVAESNNLPSNNSIKEVVPKVINEVKMISLKNPDLVVTNEYIELPRRYVSILPLNKAKKIQTSINKRLITLNNIIEQRRKELNIDSRNIKKLNIIQIQNSKSTAEERFIKLEERILKRRSGEDINDDK